MKQLEAIEGGVIAGLAYAIPVSGNGISLTDGLGIALAVLTGHQVVYWSKNRDAQP